MEDFSIEQKIVKKLAECGNIIDATLVWGALKDEKIAEEILGADIDDIVDDDCDHEPLSNEEIQEVFDNDIL